MDEGIKDEAHRLIDQLSDSANWDELMEQIWIRQSIEAGLADSDSGRAKPVEDIREAYGLEK